MTARPCPECGGLVASTIDRCPHCGYIFTSATTNQQQRVSTENPHNSLGWVILAIFLFWPLGLVSLYYHLKSDDQWEHGRASLAEMYGASARRFAKYSVYAVLIAIAIGIFTPLIFLGILA